MPTVRRIRLFALGLLLLPAALQSQTPTGRSPTEVLLVQLRELVDGFEYTGAVQLGAASADLISRMRKDQLEMYLTLTAAAYFPPDADSLQNRDLALQNLQALVRLRPDARIPVELSWDGLDALLDFAATQVFSVVVRPEPYYDLSGSDERGFVTVVASRPTDFRLVSVANGRTEEVVQDSVRTGSSAVMGFRVHDGVRRLLLPGANEFLIIARDVATSDSTVLRVPAMVTGESPPSLPSPVFDSTVLLPVRKPPNRASTIRTGVFFAVLTGAIAVAARAEEPLRSSFTVDARAIGVSVAFIGAAITAAVRDTGRPTPQNVVANERLHAEHARIVAESAAENQRRSLQYRATIRTMMVIDP